MKRSGWKLLPALLSLFPALLAAGCGVSGVPTEEDPAQPATELAVAGLQVASLTDTSAVLSWTTTRPAVGVVRIGLAADLAVSSTHTTSGFVTRHDVPLPDLQPDTRYYFAVRAITSRGDTASARGPSFRTDPHHGLNDMTPPVVSDIEVTGVTSSSALVRWRTDDLCRCTIVYGLGGAESLSQVEYPDQPLKYTRGHAMVLTDLTPNSTYTFFLQATNLASLVTDGGGATFRTLPAPTIAFCPAAVSAAAGSEFTLSLCLEQARDLAGAAVTIAFDPAAIEIVGGAAGVAPGAFFYDQGGHLFMPPVLQPAAGRLRIEASWLIEYQGNEPRGTRADGAGTLCTLRCRWRAGYAGSGTTVGFVLIDADSDGQADTRLLDFHRLPIRFESRVAEISRLGSR